MLKLKKWELGRFAELVTYVATFKLGLLSLVFLYLDC